MSLVLLDTSFLFALFSPRDSLHQMAHEWMARLRGSSGAGFVTTRSILSEFLAMCRNLPPNARQAAADYVLRLFADESIEIVVESDALFQSGINLYRARPDNAYSLTDCIAMELCRQRAITDVLTYDRDFTQEGFRALLREDPA